MICRSDITSLKTDIGDMIGQKIIVKGSLGRSKSFEKEATIQKAYPNIFVVKYEENERNVTYSYTDVLTRTVEVDVFDGENYSPLIPPIAEVKAQNNKKTKVKKRKNNIIIKIPKDLGIFFMPKQYTLNNKK